MWNGSQAIVIFPSTDVGRGNDGQQADGQTAPRTAAAQEIVIAGTEPLDGRGGQLSFRRGTGEEQCVCGQVENDFRFIECRVEYVL